MIHKLITVVLILAGTVAAAEPWQHELQPGFAAPFDMLMLPWLEPAETQDMSACWRDRQDIPFLGADFEYVCFSLPASADAEHVSVAMRDAGFVRSGRLNTPWAESPEYWRWDSFYKRGPYRAVEVWYFDHVDGPHVSFAYRQDAPLTGAAPDGPPEVPGDRVRNMDQR